MSTKLDQNKLKKFEGFKSKFYDFSEDEQLIITALEDAEESIVMLLKWDLDKKPELREKLYKVHNFLTQKTLKLNKLIGDKKL